MDPAVSLFLNTGVVHSTDKSHRAAVKAYSAFLTKEVKSRQKLRIPFSRAQIKAVRTLNPIKPPHLCPKILAVDNIFARLTH